MLYIFLEFDNYYYVYIYNTSVKIAEVQASHRTAIWTLQFKADQQTSCMKETTVKYSPPQT